MTDQYLVGSLTAGGAAVIGGALVWLGHYVAARREVVVVDDRQLINRWPPETSLKPPKVYDQDATAELENVPGPAD